jgi:hypothetical protein
MQDDNAFYNFQKTHLKKLIRRHKRLDDSPLLAAVWYKIHDKKNVYLLEVLDQFPNVANEKEIYHVSFGSSSDFIVLHGLLKLSLLSKQDFDRSLEEKWSIIREIRSDQFEILYQDPECKNLISRLYKDEQPQREKQRFLKTG